MVKKASLVLVLLGVLLAPVRANAGKYMDCYPGKNMWSKDRSYPICIIDMDGECMYCIVTVISG